MEVCNGFPHVTHHPKDLFKEKQKMGEGVLVFDIIKIKDLTSSRSPLYFKTP